ncbi:hypothetical protein GDO86_003962 [Hymenochirus boettgeri]|uniref:Small ribosomal subunit protein mS23 n=1 Tax=Hymenochirus boettgeri TaxID=247094 RepID=A0A8T2K3B5_9PIPI|nr:hypothetical protein GDO86_003962 [Hymenochirus boettgeri]
MAGSRLEQLGTVFTRVRDLLRAGVIKPTEKPIWYDVYVAFPPKRDPLYVKPARRRPKPSEVVPAILYKEDVIRAKFYETYGSGPRAFELSRSNFKSTSQRFVERYTELQRRGEVDENKLFDETGKSLLAEGIILRRKGTLGVRHEPQESEAQEPSLEINLKNILGVIKQEEKKSHCED